MSEFKASAPIEQLQGKLFGQHSSFSARLNRINGKTPEQWLAILDPNSRSYHKE